MSANERWQAEKDRDRALISAILQRAEGEPILIDAKSWLISGWYVREADPGDGPSGFVSLVCHEERRHVDFEISCCGFGVVKPMTHDRKEMNVITMKDKTNLKAELPPDWRVVDLFGEDAEDVLTNDEYAVWVDRNGYLYLGGSDGEDAYGIPAELLLALLEMWNAQKANP
jgi:hypothetical protein